jgi:hypothetical protein
MVMPTLARDFEGDTKVQSLRTHFAVWEQPQAFTEELRASFRSLR